MVSVKWLKKFFNGGANVKRLHLSFIFIIFLTFLQGCGQDWMHRAPQVVYSNTSVKKGGLYANPTTDTPPEYGKDYATVVDFVPGKMNDSRGGYVTHHVHRWKEGNKNLIEYKSDPEQVRKVTYSHISKADINQEEMQENVLNTLYAQRFNFSYDTLEIKDKEVIVNLIKQNIDEFFVARSDTSGLICRSLEQELEQDVAKVIGDNVFGYEHGSTLTKRIESPGNNININEGEHESLFRINLVSLKEYIGTYPEYKISTSDNSGEITFKVKARCEDKKKLIVEFSVDNARIQETPFDPISIKWDAIKNRVENNIKNKSANYSGMQDWLVVAVRQDFREYERQQAAKLKKEKEDQSVYIRTHTDDMILESLKRIKSRDSKL